MKNIPAGVVDFLRTQSFVILSSIDKNGFPHTACKDIVKIDPSGQVYLVDVYQGVTVENIKRNSQVSISAVDEHKYVGYCLKGKALLMPEDISQEIIKTWEDKITARLAKRLLRNLAGDYGHGFHPEASLPRPKHIILIEAEDIIDLAPHPSRKEA